MLDIPEGTVASRLFRARRALRSVLEQRIPDVQLRSRHE
jgi:DNA-directed RNA polymerase specialized sigma24 family protein